MAMNLDEIGSEWISSVQKDGHRLRDAPVELRRDRELVLAAVRFRGLALHYASEDLKRNEEVVLAAVQQDAFALEYVELKFRQINA